MPGVLTLREGGASRRHVFDEQAVIGRDLDCDIPIESRSVSRRHAILEKTPNGWTVRDLGSANGTFVAGARITQSVVTNAAAVKFGEIEGVFTVEPRDTSGAERLIASISIAPSRKARPVAVFVATTAGILLLAAATIWARYCDRAPTKASSATPGARVTGS
jgi:pSer/pThr/pTyr-binding forkhead associated (FHA) protein